MNLLQDLMKKHRIYTYHQKLLLQSSQDASANADTPDRPLADWEKIWLAQMADARRRRKEAIARGEYPEDIKAKSAEIVRTSAAYDRLDNMYSAPST